MGTKSVQSESIPQSAMLARGTMTGVLSAAAGAPCAVQVRRGREGSFLVLVVGTLALLAVITIVYVALGNADTRTKAAAQSRVQQDDVAPKVGEYIASVIADDVLATEFTGEVTSVVATSGQPGGTNLRALLRRETSDAPGVRPNLSSLAGTPPEQAFDPVGTLNAQVQSDLFNSPVAAAANPDYLIPASDPYLASTLPVNFNNEFARGQGPSSVVLPDRPYLYDLDWLAISNFAPDGAFVNLENLRNNFRASSVDLRRDKTLYTINGLPTQDTVFDTPADQNNPFHWTMYQQRAFQPGKLTAQWADADGDGMLDSRLFEMVDIFGGVGRRVAPSLNSANVRYFIAARAVDLSGMVNVTTATEFTTGTNNAFVAGATPADVDLRRLLTQADVYADQNPIGNPNTLAGYQGLIQFPDPTDLGGSSGPRIDLPQNYTLYDEASAFRAGSAAFAALRLSLATNTIVPRDVVGNPNIITLAEPDFQVTLDNSVLGAYAAQLKNFNPNQPAQLRALQAIFGAPFPATGGLPGGPAFTPEQWAAMRQVAWDQSKKSLVGGAYNAPNTNDGALPGGLFTTSDLSELLTRFGVNSDERSALEIVLGGRDGTQGQLTQRFDPLRSNRPESLELVRFEIDPATGIDDAPAFGSEQDRVMRLFGSDVRRLITPLNGARQFRSASSFIDASTGIVESVDPERLQGNELKADLRAILDAGDVSDQGDLAELYRGYADGLAPFSFIDSAWQRNQFTTPPQGLPSRTLFYGYRGPEAALLTAAHMAVNLRDFADIDTRPSAATVIFSNDVLASLNPVGAGTLPAGTNALAPLSNYAPWFAGLDNFGYREQPERALSRRLALEPEKLAVSNNDVVAPAVNVYGVEPQIFITEVSTMTIYVDDPTTTPTAGTQVSIDLDQPGNAGDPGSGPSPLNFVGSGTISEAENSEVMARVISFKIVNPFDRPVQLSRAPFSDGDAIGQNEPTNPGDEVPPRRWVNGRHFDIDAFHTFSSAPSGNPLVRPDSLRDYQYIRVGEGQGARYYMLMALQQQSVGGVYAPDISNRTGTGTRNAPPITLEPITLEPGETAILYAISEPPARIAERIDDVRNYAGKDNPADVERLITNQLLSGDLGLKRYWIPLYRPFLPASASDSTPTSAATSVAITGPGISAASGLQEMDRFVDVIPPDPATLGARSVTLWRADRRLDRELRPVAYGGWDLVDLWNGRAANENFAAPPANPSPFETTTPPRFVLAPNDVRNDVMLDRFKVPFGRPLDSAVKLDSSLGPVLSQRLRFDGTDEADPRDLNGITVVTARSYRRSGDPGLNYIGSNTPAGVLPMYCIEPKYAGSTAATALAWNLGFESAILSNTDIRTTGIVAVAGTRPEEEGPDSFLNGDPNQSPSGTSPGTGTQPVAAPLGGAFENVVDAVNVLRGTTSTGVASNPQRVLISSMFAAPFQWGVSGLLSNSTITASPEPGTFGGRSFAATHGERPEQATSLVAPALWRYYNEMYPSLLQAGVRQLATPLPTTTGTLAFVEHHMFRPFRYDIASNLLGLQLPDGRVVGGPRTAANPNPEPPISTLRLTDLLLPLGLGPMEMPVGSSGAGAWPGTAPALNPNVLPEALRRYTTLGEAVAIAMGYEANGGALPAARYDEDPALWLAPRDRSGDFRLITPQVPASAQEALRRDASDLLMLDAGNLATDRFVPFMDLNGDGVAQVDEPTWGLGIPAAANVLEQFAVITAPTGFDAPPSGNLQQRRDFAARRIREQLTTAVPGLVNINTAPVQVLRTLPMVSPLPTLRANVDQTDLIAGNTLNNNVRRTFENGVNAWDNSPFLAWRMTAAGAPTGPVIDQATDIAPTLAAYRDLYPERIRRDASIMMQARAQALNLNGTLESALFTSGANLNNQIGAYNYTGANGLANRISPALWTWAGAMNANDVLQLWTRANQTREDASGITAVRGQPGVRSPGELIVSRMLWPDAVSNTRLSAPTNRGATPTFRKDIVRGLPTNPDYLGFDQHLGPIAPAVVSRGINSSFGGLDPLQRHTFDDGALAGNARTNPDSISSTPRNLNHERLIIPGAMMSATTTRSDVFAVWFTVFGFREGDVNTPAPAPGQDPAPLLPSIQRRFLMVIDRSNVTQLGEKPRIVLFKEVPM